MATMQVWGHEFCQPMKEIGAVPERKQMAKSKYIPFKHLKGWIECSFPLHHNKRQAEVALNYRPDYSLWIFLKCDQKGVTWRKVEYSNGRWRGDAKIMGWWVRWGRPSVLCHLVTTDIGQVLWRPGEISEYLTQWAAQNEDTRSCNLCGWGNVPLRS